MIKQIPLLIIALLLIIVGLALSWRLLIELIGILVLIIGIALLVSAIGGFTRK